MSFDLCPWDETALRKKEGIKATLKKRKEKYDVFFCPVCGRKFVKIPDLRNKTPYLFKNAGTCINLSDLKQNLTTSDNSYKHAGICIDNREKKVKNSGKYGKINVAALMQSSIPSRAASKKIPPHDTDGMNIKKQLDVIVYSKYNVNI